MEARGDIQELRRDQHDQIPWGDEGRFRMRVALGLTIWWLMGKS